MLPDPQDTIVALSSAPGPGARAVVRLSGHAALAVARRVFSSADPLEAGKRHIYSGTVLLAAVASPLPADLYYWTAPHSYTGQDVVELHTISSPPLVGSVGS